MSISAKLSPLNIFRSLVQTVRSALRYIAFSFRYSLPLYSLPLTRYPFHPRSHNRQVVIWTTLLLLLALAPLVYFTLLRPNQAKAATMSLTSDVNSITITVANRYEAVLQKGDTDDYLVFKDKYEDNATPDTTYELPGPCGGYDGGGGFVQWCLRDNPNRLTTILETTQTRIKIRVSGVLTEENGSGTYENDEGTDHVITEDYTFTPYGLFINSQLICTLDSFLISACDMDTDLTHQGIEWLGVYANYGSNDTAYFTDTGNITYGTGETETTTSTDGAEFANTNTYVYIPGNGSNTYQDALIGISRNGWFDGTMSGRVAEWNWDEDNTTAGGTAQDLITAQEQNASETAISGIYHSSWYFLLQPEANLDTKAEREAWANELQNPDYLTITTGSQGYDPADRSPAVGGFSENTGYINVVDANNALDITSHMTLEAWIFLNREVNLGQYWAILGKGASGSNRGNYFLELADNENLGFSLYASSAWRDTGYDDGAIPIGQWTHVAAVFDDTADTVTLYRNGQLLSTNTSFTWTPVANSDPLVIGAYEGPSGLFNGSIDEVRIWNVARTQAQLQSDMSRPIDSNSPGLVGYWRLDEAADTTALDEKGGNPGTLTSGPLWVQGVVPGHFNRGENAYTIALPSVQPNQGLFALDAGPNISTLLNGAVSTAATGFTVDSTTTFPSSGAGYIFGDKYTYTGTTATTFTGVPSSGTNAVIAHADNTVVASFNRHNPFFKFSNWRSLGLPDLFTLEGRILTPGTDYNGAVKPITDADFYNATGTSYTQLAIGGDNADSAEYLHDDSNNYTLAFNESGDYLYIGCDTQYQGVNISLATLGSGSSPVFTWQYCSVNSDPNTACDTWSNLVIRDTTIGTSNFTASGNFYFTAPGDWFSATVNSGPSLYYLRGNLASGSFSTSPVESQIKTDILLLNYLGTLTSTNQTFALNTTGDTEESGGPPVSRWSIDEASGTTASDQNAEADNDLTITNAVWTITDDDYAPHHVYLYFDGNGDYLTRSRDGDFDFDTGSFTFTGWFKHISTVPVTNPDYLLASHSSAGYKVYMDTSGYLCFGIDDDTSWGPDDSVCTPSGLGSLADSRWHHFAAVKTTTSSIKIYIDGNLVNTNASLTATGSLDTRGSWYLGNDTDGSTNGWVGYLDDVQLYHYARSAAQVKVDYVGGAAVVGK